MRRTDTRVDSSSLSAFSRLFMLIAAIAFSMAAFSTSIHSSTTFATRSVMIDLTQPDEYQHWRATNDNVMGGISQGQFSFDGKSSRFWGELSLANNGGFSAVSRPIDALPAEINRVVLQVMGDGCTYQLRFATWLDGYRINYKHDFAIHKGEQQTIELTLSDFQAVFRGRLLSGAPTLRAKDIKQVGLLIADKQAGPFTLAVFDLQFLTSNNVE